MSTHQQPQLDLQQLSVGMGPAFMLLEHNYQPPQLPRTRWRRFLDTLKDKWWRFTLYFRPYILNQRAYERKFWRRD
jgi:hypothetical protein